MKLRNKYSTVLKAVTSYSQTHLPLVLKLMVDVLHFPQDCSVMLLLLQQKRSWILPEVIPTLVMPIKKLCSSWNWGLVELKYQQCMQCSCSLMLLFWRDSMVCNLGYAVCSQQPDGSKESCRILCYFSLESCIFIPWTLLAWLQLRQFWLLRAFQCRVLCVTSLKINAVSLSTICWEVLFWAEYALG